MGVSWPSVILYIFRSPIDASPAPVQYEALMWSGCQATVLKVMRDDRLPSESCRARASHA